MAELPRVPAAGLFFGHLARGGARTLPRLLGRARIRDGLVVDLGAGSGITARVLTDAGYRRPVRPLVAAGRGSAGTRPW